MLVWIMLATSLAVAIAVALWWYGFRRVWQQIRIAASIIRRSPRHVRPASIRNFASRAKTNLRGIRQTGLYLGPIFTTVFVRGALSLIAGFGLAGLVYTLDAWLEAGVMSQNIFLALGTVASIWFGLNDEKQPGEDAVPETYAALLTFFGRRIPVYLREGRYPWKGKKLLFDRFRSPVPGMADQPNLEPAKRGFVFIGELVLPIWNESTDKNNIILSNVARDTSTVSTNLTIGIRVRNLYRWVGQSDPIFNIAERSRAAFRTAIAFFTGFDCAAVKTLLGRLMIGKTIVTSFVAKQVGANLPWSIIQDDSGGHLYRIVEEGQTIAQAKTAFRRDLQRADPDMLKAVRKDGNDKPRIETRSIDDHLVNVLDDTGAELTRVSVADFTFSEEVERRANIAAGEVLQRDAQIRSANAVKAARQILAPTKKQMEKPGYELAMLLAAAQDNDQIKVVVVPGADRLTRAAVAGGTQIGGN